MKKKKYYVEVNGRIVSDYSTKESALEHIESMCPEDRVNSSLLIEEVES